MIDCKKCEDLIQKELDGEIREFEAAELRAHIEKCSPCRKEWQSFEAMLNVLREDKQIAPPPNFISRLTAKLDNKPKVGFVEGYVVPFFMQNRIRLAMASFILVVAGFGLLYSFYQDEASLGNTYDRNDAYTGATIGIRTAGHPTFIIPADEDAVIEDENSEAVEEFEEALRGIYYEDNIHTASD